jgi:GNAT superfamily N-acetyltransferase
MREAFEAYIGRSFSEDIDRISDYYRERGAGSGSQFEAHRIIGMFGLERGTPGSFEVLHMYVDPSAQRTGVASAMLHFAEDHCRRLGVRRIELSTSELQPAAIMLVQAGRISAAAQGGRVKCEPQSHRRRRSAILLREVAVGHRASGRRSAPPSAHDHQIIPMTHANEKFSSFVAIRNNPHP